MFHPPLGDVRGLRNPGPAGPPSLKICHWQIFRALRALLLRAREQWFRNLNRRLLPAGRMLVSVEDYASLHPPQAALRLRPPGPQPAIWLTTKTKQFARGWFTSPGKFLGKRKRKLAGGESLLSPHAIFRFPRCAMRTAGQRATLAAQERWSALKPLVVIC